MFSEFIMPLEVVIVFYFNFSIKENPDFYYIESSIENRETGLIKTSYKSMTQNR